MTNPVPTLHFDSAVLPADAAFAQWAAVMTAYEIYQPEGVPAAAFTGTADAWMLGDAIVTDAQLSPLRFVRSAARASADAADHYSFLLLREGSWTGDVDGRLLTVGPGQVVAFDMRRPMDAEGGSTDVVTLGMSRDSLAAAMGTIPDLHGAILDGPTGRLLADHLMALARELPRLQLDQVPALVKATAGLIAACAAAQPGGAGGTRDVDLRHKVSRYIDRQLEAPELGVERICAELGLSRSVLYRALAPLGGVASYIRTRRLEAVHVLLGDRRERRSIATIAHAFGFVSEAHFSRVFRRRFGYSPRQLRSGGGVAGADVDAGQLGDFVSWLDRLG
jgi:AraC-like DNA-binding protein